jgi:hypothetical protein
MPLPEHVRSRVLERACRVLNAEYDAFGHAWRKLPQGEAEWRTHPQSGYEFPGGPWWTVPDLPPSVDIKDVWEPGRFTWVYDLIRAFAGTGDSRFAAAFHHQLNAWATSNPPFRGPQWACGQETAIRALAILHGDAAFTARSDDESRQIADVLGWSGERIADAIGYGLCQRNNHGISESAGLVHLGLRLQHAHPDASRWLQLGRQYLAEQILDQFAEDGWYAQHSFAYMRVALEQALVAQRVLAQHALSLPADCLDRLRQGVALLAAVAAGGSGIVPNHGANDGGRVVPYSTAPLRDFRPTLTLGAIVLRCQLPADLRPDPEVVAWLGVEPPPRGSARPDGVRFGRSGWAVARVGRASVFLRAGTLRHRPSHLDQLHIDVRFGEEEVITDAGTYAYNAAPPWNNGLASAIAHNGPVLDDREPAERGPRFLWRSWPEAQLLRCEYDGTVAVLAGEVPGRSRRTVEVRDQQVTVIDQIVDPQTRVTQITWLLHPSCVGRVSIEADGCEAIAAQEGRVDGWFSPTYGLRLPSRAMRIRRTVDAIPATVTTTIRPGRMDNRL